MVSQRWDHLLRRLGFSLCYFVWWRIRLARRHNRFLCYVLFDEYYTNEKERSGRYDERGCQEGLENRCRVSDLAESIQYVIAAS